MLVAACGNALAGDDAFGPLVARRLRQLSLPNVRVVDLDIRPAALLDHLPGPSGIILVDAVLSPGAKPSDLIDMDWFDAGRPPLAHDDALSTHGLGLADQLHLAQVLGLLPGWVHLLATPVVAAGIGQAPSAHLEAAVDAAVRRIADLLATMPPERQPR